MISLESTLSKIPEKIHSLGRGGIPPTPPSAAPSFGLAKIFGGRNTIQQVALDF